MTSDVREAPERSASLLAGSVASGTVGPVARTVRPAPFDREIELEVHQLVREHEGAVHQVRLDRLGKQAAAAPSGIAVQHSTSGFCGDRVNLFLDDGRLVRLHLYWPHREAIIAIIGVRWTERMGWLVDVRTTAGDVVRVFAWRARVLLPHRSADRHHAGWSLLG